MSEPTENEDSGFVIPEKFFEKLYNYTGFSKKEKLPNNEEVTIHTMKGFIVTYIDSQGNPIVYEREEFPAVNYSLRKLLEEYLENYNNTGMGPQELQ